MGGFRGGALVATVLLAMGCSGSDGATATSVAVTTIAELTSTTEAPSTSAAATTVEPSSTTVTTEPEPEPLRSLVWIHDEEPPDLHYWDPANGSTAASWLREPLLEDLWGVTVANGFYPELLERDAVLTEHEDGSVTAAFVLRQGLTWSDGVPLTSADVRFTYDVIVARLPDDETGELSFSLSHSDRSGYETIVDFQVVGDTEFSITWSTFYPGYKELFSNVLPAHALPGGAEEAERALRGWNNDAGDTLPSSGPLLFDGWDPGVELRYLTNPLYHGSASPDSTATGPSSLDEVVVRFATDAASQVNAMKQVGAHLMTAQPIPDFGPEITEDPTFSIASSGGQTYEHWGLNLLNAHLADPLVREALVLAIDKSELVEVVYRPIFGDVLAAEGLGNTYWMANQAQYEDHQAQYGGARTDEAIAKLAEAGYTQGPDGVMQHEVRGPLVLRVGTTSGNTIREIQQQLIAATVARAGIQVVIDNLPGAEYFANRPFAPAALAASASRGREGDPAVWDIAQFAWNGGPWPGRQSRFYRYDSGVMPYGFVSDDFNAKARQCDRTVDELVRDVCYSELDRWVTTLDFDGAFGLFVIPLTQKPTFYAYNAEVLAGVGAAPDGNRGGPLANVVDFSFVP